MSNSPIGHIASLITVAFLASGLTAFIVSHPESSHSVAKHGESPAGETGAPSAQTVLVERQVLVREAETKHENNDVAHASANDNTASTNPLNREAQEADYTARIVGAFGDAKPGNADSKKVEDQLRGAFTDKGVSGVKLNRLECRLDVCKAETTFASRDAEEQTFQRLMLESQSNRYSLVVPIRHQDRDGSMNAEMYLFAPGSMPQPPSQVQQESRVQ